ncbi:MAG TPA: response regulator [Candidatus Saccharimonadales bacterium]|nr:response regulator [Candidatus Saccharimonadales bacterium]
MHYSCSVMIVDDDCDMIQVYGLYFTRLGIDSICFSNPQIALDHFQQYHDRYCVVLLDWNLPNINGFELAKRMRKYDSDVKIVLLTGRQIDDLLKNEILIESKVSDILIKPICIDVLGSRLLELCSQTDSHKKSSNNFEIDSSRKT